MTEKYIEDEVLSFFLSHGAKGIDPEAIARVLRRLGDEHLVIQLRIDEIVERYRRMAD